MHTTSPSEKLQEGFRAWTGDLEQSVESEFTVEIVPLACLWSAAVLLEDRNRNNVTEFTADILSADGMRDIVQSRLHRTQATLFQLAPLPTHRIYYTGTTPSLYEAKALRSGREALPDKISGAEYVLVSTIGQAAYDSASGVPLLRLEPFGEDSRHPGAWRVLGFPKSQAFVDSLTS